MNLVPLDQDQPYRSPTPMPKWSDDPSDAELALFDATVASYVSSGLTDNWRDRAKYAIEMADLVVGLRRERLGRR